MKKHSVKNVRFSLVPQFREALRYISESKRFIYAIVVLFFVGALFGFLLHNYLGVLDSILRSLVDQTKGLFGFDLIAFIFRNNMEASLFSILYGFFLGVFPLLSSLGNGIVLGYVAQKAQIASGFITLWRLLPHGIFELPAVLISLGLGMRLGLGFFELSFSRYKRNRFRLFVVLLSVIASLFGAFLILLGLGGLFELASGVTSSLLLSSLSALLFGGALVYPLFMFLFGDAALRKEQSKDFLRRLWSSLHVFFYIVLPLLAIAAIIEGLLIFFVK